MLVFGFFVVGWGLTAQEQYAQDAFEFEAARNEEVCPDNNDTLSLDDEFPAYDMADSPDTFSEFDPNLIRAISLEEIAPPTLGERVSFILDICKHKSSKYRQELITHLKQHSNEYLIGSSIVGVAALICLLKYCSSKPAQS